MPFPPKRIIKFICFLIIIGELAYLSFFNPRLKILAWRIEGAESLDEKEVLRILKKVNQKSLGGILPREFFFTALLGRSYLENTLKISFPEIEKISIKPDWKWKNFWQTLKIEIQEHQKIGIWCNLIDENDVCFYFNKEGLLFKKAPETQGPFLILIKNESNLNPRIKEKIVNQKLLSAILYLKETFAKTDFCIRHLRIFSLNPDIALKTTEGWELYFDPKEDVARAFKVFLTILSEKLQPTATLEYVDLRIRNKAFIKRRP